MQEIYTPSNDSFFFAEFLKKTLTKKNLSFLNMGCGSCILSDTVKKMGITNITCADINQNAVDLAEKKGYKGVHSNLFKNIKNSYDIITFNAPYLPDDKQEPEDSKTITTGGKKGDELSLKFITQAKKHLNKNGTIYLLISSLTPIENIKKHNPKIVARKKMFFEELYILKLHR